MNNKEYYTKMDKMIKEGLHMIKLASPIEYENIVNGPGMRIVIWNQGCPLRCEGCHNAETQTLFDGRYIRTQTVKNHIKKHAPHHRGITLTGGDPFLQPRENKTIADFAHSIGLDVWAYSGQTFEGLKENNETLELLKSCDVLVDGPFILSLRDVSLPFRGSSNQRIIDVQKSLQTDTVVIIEGGF